MTLKPSLVIAYRFPNPCVDNAFVLLMEYTYTVIAYQSTSAVLQPDISER